MSVLKILQPVRFLPTSVAWSVSQLFAAGEQGAWYDPSDLSTLFQDEAGTTPVTAVEQPVGRILDKSGRGNHATQATTTKRPVLSRQVNQFTNTAFSGAVAGSPGTAPTGWSYPLSTGNLGLGGDGILSFTTSATRSAISQALSTSPNTSYVLSVKVNANIGLPLVQICIFNQGLTGATELWRVNGTAVSPNSYVPVAGDLITGTLQVAGSAGAINPRIGAGVSGVATGSVSISQPSITLATDAHLPYQWVNTATDYDADPAKFPAYLRFDGVDDALQTGNIDFTSTDKMTVWAGVTKLSNSDFALLLEHGTAAANADFSVWAPYTGSNYRGDANQAGGDAALSPALLAPRSDVLSLIGDRASGRVTTLRVAGGVYQSALKVPPGGNYTNQGLYIGARGGTSNYFNGRLYSLIVRGAQTGGATVEAVERYIKSKVRMP